MRKLTLAQEIGTPVEPMRDQLSWEEIRALVWSLPMTKAARQLGITNTALRKKCFRMKIDAPPQGYWQTPPANRAIFLERTNRSHKSEPEAPLKLAAAQTIASSKTIEGLNATDAAPD